MAYFTGKCVTSCKAWDCTGSRPVDGVPMLTVMHIPISFFLLYTVMNGINIAGLVFGSKWVQ